METGEARRGADYKTNISEVSSLCKLERVISLLSCGFLIHTEDWILVATSWSYWDEKMRRQVKHLAHRGIFWC